MSKASPPNIESVLRTYFHGKDENRPHLLRGVFAANATLQVVNRVGTIARFFERVLVEGEAPYSVRKDVEDFRLPLQKLYYCFGNGWPASSFSQADSTR